MDKRKSDRDHRVKLLLLGLRASLLLLVLLFPFDGQSSLAAGCSGSSCMGKNPQTMGCGSDAITKKSGSYGDGSRVQNRESSACNAEWTRTINQAVGSRYAAASSRYGCANYCYHKSTSSPGTIARNQQVYSSMVGPDSTISTKSCGRVSTSGPISTPVTIQCPGVN